MYTGTLGPITNDVTWDEAFQLYDADVGPDEYIDLTGAVVTITLKDQETGCTVLTGSSDGGEIIVNEAPGVIQFNFSDTALNRLCGTYDAGIRMKANDITRQLFVGTAIISKGIDTQ